MYDKLSKLIEKARLKDTLEQVFNLTLEQRIERGLEIKPHGIIPNSHFAAVSAECYDLYRDGYYYGAISLIQAVAEALVKFLCNVNFGSDDKNNHRFKENLRKLEKGERINVGLRTLLMNIWQGRNDYHHLNIVIEQDRQKLEELAKEKLSDLKKVEESLFAYSVNNGKLVPKFPKYWDIKKDRVPVYLRLD